MQGEAPGTVGLCFDWSSGNSRCAYMTSDEAREEYRIRRLTVDEAELARLTRPPLRLVEE